MMAVTQSELTDFNLKHHIAPVVPKLMAITGVVNACGWFVSFGLKNPNLGYLAVVHILGGLALILLGGVCQRTASAGRANETTVVSITFVFATAALLCLVAINNNTGLLQSLPYCMMLTAVSGFFWPTRWGLVVGSIAGMTPPVVLVFTGHSVLSLTPRFFAIYAQLWLSALAVSFFLYVFMDRARRRYLVALRELEDQSHRDVLTGLINRRHFYDQVAARHSDALFPENGGGALLLYMDVDHFKSVNDRFGHAAGDRVLQQAARALQQACEPSDVIARFGGEEFVLYRTDAESAEDEFAVLTAQLQNALRRSGGLQTGEAITVSAGGTVMLPDELLDAALQRADEALMRAKQAGRNCMIFAPAPIAASDHASAPARDTADASVAGLPQVVAA